jgi:hypothetical protein
MANASQIREIIAEYVSKRDAGKFVRDFSAISYNIHLSKDAEAVDLAQKVIGKMADLHSGCISRSAFLDCLRQFVLAPTQILYTDVHIAASGSNYDVTGLGFVVAGQAESPVRFVDTRPALVRAS